MLKTGPVERSSHRVCHRSRLCWLASGRVAESTQLDPADGSSACSRPNAGESNLPSVPCVDAQRVRIGMWGPCQFLVFRSHVFDASGHVALL